MEDRDAVGRYSALQEQPYLGPEAGEYHPAARGADWVWGWECVSVGEK